MLRKLTLATALAAVIALPAMAQDVKARNAVRLAALRAQVEVAICQRAFKAVSFVGACASRIECRAKQIRISLRLKKRSLRLPVWVASGLLR